MGGGTLASGCFDWLKAQPSIPISYKMTQHSDRNNGMGLMTIILKWAVTSSQSMDRHLNVHCDFNFYLVWCDTLDIFSYEHSLLGTVVDSFSPADVLCIF